MVTISCPLFVLFSRNIFSKSNFYIICILTDVSSAVLLSRHVVPASCGLWLLPAPHPSVGRYCTSLSTNQRGPKVWLASCHFSHVHQQVSPAVTLSLPEGPTALSPLDQMSSNMKIYFCFFEINPQSLRIKLFDPTQTLTLYVVFFPVLVA